MTLAELTEENFKTGHKPFPKSKREARDSSTKLQLRASLSKNNPNKLSSLLKWLSLWSILYRATLSISDKPQYKWDMTKIRKWVSSIGRTSLFSATKLELILLSTNRRWEGVSSILITTLTRCNRTTTCNKCIWPKQVILISPKLLISSKTQTLV